MILWILAVLNIGYGIFMFVGAEEELGVEIRKLGVSLADVDPAKYAEALGKIKLIYGANIGLGVLFAICALLVNRAPVIATVSGLVLFLGATAALIAMEPSAIMQGIIMRIFIIVGLISAMKSAIAVERQERAERAAQ